ncbi:asparagine--tRNA ligase [Nitrososphaera viennensis EN76]|uniref:Asparagine--tRNA ligase n=2 Tax=Nitrososphaera viennensis TaxID=1034015 RepID=A0A060HUY8_9ARCH|nr:asparagine--tRNA ligase [Nitrososphaera viennensis EN76]
MHDTAAIMRASEVKNASFIGKEVTIRGWVHRLRKQKENSFILLRDDRGGVIQCVLPTDKAAGLTIESSVQVTGIVSQDPRAPEGGFEIKGKELKIFNIAAEYPIGEYQSDELLLDKRHLALRTRKMIAMAKVRASVLHYGRRWFVENGWMEVTAPTIVKGAVEGGSTLFKLRYFDQDAYLSQSAQLYLEAMIFSLGPVWSLTPSFRAEKSRTVRHLAEFSHLEAEAPWVTLEDILKVEEQLVSYVIQNTIKERAEELEFLKRDVSGLKKVEPPFERVPYGRAIEILRSKGFQVTEDDGTKREIQFGDDLSIDSERELTKDADKPVFVVGYPIAVKPFYVKEDPEHPGIGLTADMLAPRGFGEITSGGQREDSIDSITSRMVKEGLKPEAYEWYLDLRRYGSVPHGGFGLGIERLVRWITNAEDIKDTVLFPRTMSRVEP